MITLNMWLCILFMYNVGSMFTVKKKKLKILQSQNISKKGNISMKVNKS